MTQSQFLMCWILTIALVPVVAIHMKRSIGHYRDQAGMRTTGQLLYIWMLGVQLLLMLTTIGLLIPRAFPR